MTNENTNSIKQLELLNENICNACQEYTFDTSAYYVEIFNKIRNASLFLFNNAARIYHKQTSLIKSGNTPITIKQTQSLMLKIYQVLQDMDLPLDKEKKLKSLIENDFNINPDYLLTPNHPADVDILNTANILNGNIL